MIESDWLACGEPQPMLCYPEVAAPQPLQRRPCRTQIKEMRREAEAIVIFILFAALIRCLLA
jgi:hypothetical protein